MELVTFTIILDDIVYPDGHTVMAALGGGGPQTAFGAIIWMEDDSRRVGIAASVGPDFPESCQRWLADMTIDTTGLSLAPLPTLRAWQILEADGRRTQVWRVDTGDEISDMLRPPINSLPHKYQHAMTYHVGVHPSAHDVEFIHSLRNTGAIVSIETYTHATEMLTHSEIKALVSSAHVFSPNEREAISLVGPGSPTEIITRLVEFDAEVVVLRRGSLGCIVHRSDNGETWEIPAFHAVFRSVKASEHHQQTADMISGVQNIIHTVVDPTGCGNTFCGGFIIGWWKTRDLLTSALWGSVSASIMLEHEGIPPPNLSQWRRDAKLRFQMLHPHARQIFLRK